MSHIWNQVRAGRAADLLEPERNVIEFDEIADTLANNNRYNGCAEGRQVSVAFHTIIGASIIEPELIPWFLIHDAHEAFIGDIVTPVAHALQALGDEIMPRHDMRSGGDIVKAAIRELKHRHDIAIHAAAGLDMPDPWAKAAIRLADLRAMNTERRDFLAEEPAPWHDEVVAAGSDPRRWNDRWQSPWQTADELKDLFRRHLPVFTSRRIAA